MASKSLSLLFFTLLSLALALNAASAVKHDPEVGSWKPIKDTKDPKAVEIAKFAVSEHNKKVNSLHKLIFEEIEKGEFQVVAGIKYRLTIKTKTTNDNHLKPRDSGEYEAVVWDKPSEHIRKLISFNRVKKN